MYSYTGVHNIGVYNDFRVCSFPTRNLSPAAPCLWSLVHARPSTEVIPLNDMRVEKHEKYYQCHHGMGISGNRSSTTNIFSSDSFGISVIYTFWAIHPCKNNHLPISFRAVIVNSNLFLTITALPMLFS